ncbi:MAG: aminopeptidase P family protein [Candidatus Nitrosocaldus sp.]|nr:aminopeptidase P family protein [Candidatus Nitrosocaldus sp.]MDW7999832.1 aminopeptidase P family protein [Candidatus Nitrosocaldus sp.]
MDGLGVGSRGERVLDEAYRIGCSTVMAFEPEDVFYLTGFWGEGIAVLNQSGTRLIVPQLEADRARSVARCEVLEAERGSSMLDRALSLVGDGASVCTDCSDHSLFERMKVRLVESSRLRYSKDVFYNARRVKDGYEISIIERASSILDELFRVCEYLIRAGMSERQIQAMLMYEAMVRGAYPPAYRYTLSPLIVASGTNSSLPHAEPSDRVVSTGDLITIDLTLRYNGYIADATRTFALGSIDGEREDVYYVVREAQQRALDAVCEGVQCRDVDGAARSYIEGRGYGERFIHSTGHGIGLDVHEPPWISRTSQDTLARGMCITVEPGIYIHGRYGVRIEDSVAIRDDGRVVVMNRYTKDLIRL